MKVVILDGTTAPTKEALHQHLARELSFPDWYGGNLDALHDCLTELMEEVDIRIIHTAELKAVLGDYADALLRVLRDAEQVNLNIQIVTD